MENGIILKGVGGKYEVFTEKGVFSCTLDGKNRIKSLSPLCGDRCETEIDTQSAHILRILPRKNEFIRPAIANIDCLFIVASDAAPKTDTYLIDKLTVTAEYKSVRPIIVLNKSDIDESKRLCDIYTCCGFDVINVSAKTGEGIEKIAQAAKGMISAFAGNSGIGKSSILNRLIPGANRQTGEISSKIERGKQTTRHCELVPFNGGFIADTPGFSSFEIAAFESIKKEELQLYFPEMCKITEKCRFSDCAHIGEPGCAVLNAISANDLLKSRYESYKRIYSDLSRKNQY